MKPGQVTKWIRTGSLALAAAAALLFAPHPVQADISPPERPPGANPQPGSELTQVRMVAETVTLNVLEKSPAGSLAQARVTAVFQMRNLGAAEEKMDVRFPLQAYGGGSTPWDAPPMEISDLTAKVGGRAVGTRRVLVPPPAGKNGDPTPWAAFPIAFPPGKDVSIEVAYTQYGMGESVFVAFKYLLETGAPWKDTIGSADLVVRLPYDANDQNAIFAEHLGFSETTPNAAVAGRELRWHFADFEPTWENNLEVSLIIPEVWRRTLTERENVRKNPKDGEAWGRLGKLCKDMIFLRKGVRADPGGLALYQESLAAYEQAVTLKPRDALWHLGFADLLWGHYYWNVLHSATFAHYQGTPADMGVPELLRAVSELKASLDLNPNTPRALELLERMSYSIDGVVEIAHGTPVFLALTATPVFPTSVPPKPAPTETPAPQPSATAVQTPTRRLAQAAATVPPTVAPSSSLAVEAATAAPSAPAGTAEAVSQKGIGLPICGAGIILPVLFAVIRVRRFGS